MTTIQVFIEDQVRKQHMRINLDANRRIAALIGALVKDYQLPRRNLKGRPLEYRLVRALDGRTLASNKSLYELGIANREILRLVCPQGRQTWITIQEILEQIESEITDQVTGKVKEEVEERVWRSVKQKVEQLERTHTDDPRLKQIRRWMDFVEITGDLSSYMDWAQKLLDLFNFKSLGIGLLKLLLAVGLSIITLRVAETTLALWVPDDPAPAIQSPAPPAPTLAAPTAAPATPAAAAETEAVEAPASPTPIPPTPVPPTPVTPEPVVPTPCAYPERWVKIVVRPGDSLRSLAHEYDSSVKGLIAANCLADEQLVVGSELYVPRVPPRTPTPQPTIYWPPAPVRTRPTRVTPSVPEYTPETSPVEPVQTEPVTVEPVQTEPVTVEPVRTEPVVVEPVQTEPPIEQGPIEPPVEYTVPPLLLQTLPPLLQYWLPTPTTSWPVIR